MIGRKPTIRLPTKLFEYVTGGKLSKYLCTFIGVGELLILRLACICTCDCFGRKVSGLLTVPTKNIQIIICQYVCPIELSLPPSMHELEMKYR